MTFEEIYEMSRAERRAWLDAPHGRALETSRGHRWTLVMISLTKKALQSDMPAAMRLEFLEHLERMSDLWLKPEYVAMVEPMCDEAYEIAEEANKLGPAKSLDVFAEHPTFKAFCTLNPSLIMAIISANERFGYKLEAA